MWYKPFYPAFSVQIKQALKLYLQIWSISNLWHQITPLLSVSYFGQLGFLAKDDGKIGW